MPQLETDADAEMTSTSSSASPSPSPPSTTSPIPIKQEMDTSAVPTSSPAPSTSTSTTTISSSPSPSTSTSTSTSSSVPPSTSTPSTSSTSIIPSTSPSTSPTPSTALVKTESSSSGDTINPELLKIYYDRLFPTSLMYRWLSYGDPQLIRHREFSFTLHDDIYIRYCAFATKDDLKSGLLSRIPYKIDIGAIFNAPPNLHTTVAKFAPVSKELVFDIDMTDYDAVRTCCKKADICHRCWPLMTAAIKVVDQALREDFGFEHLMWVYSGRRGVHCWVCDKRARTLSNEARTAVVEYLALNISDNQKLNLTLPIHPALIRAYDTLEPLFRNYISDQNLFDGEQGCRQLLDFLDTEYRDQERLKFRDADADGVSHWNEFKKNVTAYQAIMKRQSNSLRTVLQRIVFTYMYPRLDVNVSKQLNHLLKSPFCIHPKTGRVCVPIDPERCDEFDYEKVPTLSQLHDELNATTNDQKDERGKPIKAWRQTSMARYLDSFAAFVKPLEESRHVKMEQTGGVLENW